MKCERHPKNAPGPFYVIKDMCLACMAPEAEAPDLIAHEEPDYYCYFKKQPTTPAELDQAIKAIAVGCCGAVRYAGSDSVILDRLSKLDPNACDKLSPGDLESEK